MQVRTIVAHFVPKSDAELLRQFVDTKDNGAFAELVRRYQRLVLSACRCVLRHEQDAEDAVQAAFLVLSKRAASLLTRAAIGAWLYGVARRVALHQRRKSRRRVAPLQDVEAMASENRPLAQDECDIVCEALAQLPEQYREPVLLCLVEGHSHSEAATVLKVSVGTLKGRLKRGRNMLRDCLKNRGVALSSALASLAAVPSVISAGSPTELAARILCAPSQRACELAWAVTAGTAMWKWAAGAAFVLVLVGSAVAVVPVTGRPEAPTVVANTKQEPPRASGQSANDDLVLKLIEPELRALFQKPPFSNNGAAHFQPAVVKGSIVTIVAEIEPALVHQKCAVTIAYDIDQCCATVRVGHPGAEDVLRGVVLHLSADEHWKYVLHTPHVEGMSGPRDRVYIEDRQAIEKLYAILLKLSPPEARAKTERERRIHRPEPGGQEESPRRPIPVEFPNPFLEPSKGSGQEEQPRRPLRVGPADEPGSK